MAYGSKEFVNNTPYDLEITLLIRQWDDPALLAGTEIFLLEVNSRKLVSYGQDTGSVYLNGLTLSWETDGSRCRQAQIVLHRGSSFDNALNMTDCITIDAISPLGLSCSHSY